MAYTETLVIPSEGDAIDEKLLFDGWLPPVQISITKALIFADVAPTGQDLTIDITLDQAEQGSLLTLTDGSTYEETTLGSAVTALTTQEVGFIFKQIGSTLPGSGIKLVIFYSVTETPPGVTIGVSQSNEANRATIRTKALLLCGNNSQLSTSQLNTLIANENAHILEYEWSRRNVDVVVTTVAPVTGSDAGVTNDSTTVTSASAAEAHVGRYLRVGSENMFFKITAASAGVSWTIEKAWPHDTDTAQSFTVFQHIYALDTATEQVVSVASGQSGLTERTREYLDGADPYRISSGSTALTWAQAHRGDSGEMQIELYPPPSATAVYRVKTLQVATMTTDTSSPLYPAYLLEFLAATRACEYLYAVTGEQKFDRLATRYLTQYENARQRAINEDARKYGLPGSVYEAGAAPHSDDFWIARNTRNA